MAEALDDLEARAARRRREKPQLSCNLCRKRKLRCDRCQPCHNCSRRGLADSCAFPESDIPRAATSHSSSPSQLPANVKDRVKQLESQVHLLMGALQQRANPATLASEGSQAQAQAQPQDGPEDDAHLQDIMSGDLTGYMDPSQDRTSYVGSAHWMAIMRNILELNDIFGSGACFQGEHADLTNLVDEPEIDLMGWHEKVTRQDILNAIPSKDFADSLVSVCFVNTVNEAMMVHPPTFRKEYERFWEDPTAVPIIWIGQLFALMCLAVQYQRFSTDEHQRLQLADFDPDKLINLYREKTIQCLVLGRYFLGPRYTIETLLLYAFIESLRGETTKNLDGPWVLWGTIVRIAFRAGYHRDGSHFPDISCFEAETRRRVWAILVGWDMYLSVQYALPRIINLSLCDTTEPRNLYDEDLYDHMIELPTARPDFAKSFSQFHVAKNRLLEIFRSINDLTMSVTSRVPYSKVLKLDSSLTSTFDAIIPVWQTRIQPQAPGSSPSDSAANISVLYTFLAFIYHRAQIVLHRKYVSLGRKHKQYTYSRKVGIEAALIMLQHQWVLYLETQVGGQLCRHGWKFLVLLNQDFLFATAVLCAELAEEISLARAYSNDDSSDDLRNRVFHALSSSYIVWLQSNDSESSREVKIVVAALKHLLGRAQEAGFGQAKMIAPTPPGPPTSASTAANSDGMGSTPSEHQQLGHDIGVQPPETGGIYFGISHFPI